MTDTHRCINDATCRRHETVDQEKLGQRTERPNTLCPDCIDYHRKAIHQLPRDWRMLRVTIGERHTKPHRRVKTTPTPAIPVNTDADKIMADITEWADRAAAIITDATNTEPPNARRKPPPDIYYNGETYTVQTGSIAHNADNQSAAHEHRQLSINTNTIERNLNELATSGNHDITIWDHTGENTGQPITRNPETGEPTTGNGHIYTTTTGIDILHQLTKLHHLTRAHLGHTRLRHAYSLPCPAINNQGEACGAHTVGRWDGNAFIDCTTCEASWTDLDYRWLVGLITERHREMEWLKHLLAEAYWRLDRVQATIDTLQGDDTMQLAGAGPIILERLATILNDGPEPHQTPAQRATGTDPEATALRQDAEDSKDWRWANETPYKKPRRKTIAQHYDGPRLADSSRSTIVTADPTPADGPICEHCNLIHPGECA